ncbi:MAG: fused response regulator/phosphatase [Gammaproteobacteria bacterium]|nr:fused response regulator/phosphatase [Gammaproteobacteria bacterium]
MKILVVDDDSTNRMVLKGLLEKDSHTVFMAENGQEAVEKFHEHDPGMVLMDIMMPVMDGYEATRVIKQECGDRFVPIMFLTAMSGEEALVNCIENGGDDFLKKPYNRTILSAKIAALERIQSLYSTVSEQRRELAAFHEHTTREHEVAEKIFANVISQGDPDLPMMRALRKPAEAFNGDMVLAARNSSGGVNLMVGDFTGHGLAAAIAAMPVADVFYKMSAKGFPIEDIIPEVNSKIRNLLPTGRFLAAILIHVETQCRSIQVWNGGMPDVIVADKDGKLIHRLPSTRVPLGVLDPVEMNPKPEVVDIQPSNRLYAFSDGIIETVDEAGEMFGQHRLEQLIGEYAGKTGLTNSLTATLEEYRKGGVQIDDITLLEFDCEPNLLIRLNENKNSVSRKPATHWSMNLKLQHDVLKSMDPLHVLIQALSEIQGFHGQREHLFSIFSELYNNALDHGLLNLDSSMKYSADGFTAYYVERDTRLRALDAGHIDIQLHHQPTEQGGRLTIEFEDSGEGFDYSKHNWELSDNMTHSGRGLSIIKQLCSKISFSGNGNTVQIVFDWKF